MHNKPGMKPLDSSTKTGKVVDEIIRTASCFAIKSNLCDYDYLPKDKKVIYASNLEWNARYKPNKDTIIILLGDWVQKNFLLTEAKIIKVAHPSSLFGSEKRKKYIADVVIQIENEIARQHISGKEHICIQTGRPCGFPCHGGCPVYRDKPKWLTEKNKAPAMHDWTSEARGKPDMDANWNNL